MEQLNKKELIQELIKTTAKKLNVSLEDFYIHLFNKFYDDLISDHSQTKTDLMFIEYLKDNYKKSNNNLISVMEIKDKFNILGNNVSNKFISRNIRKCFNIKPIQKSIRVWGKVTSKYYYKLNLK